MAVVHDNAEPGKQEKKEGLKRRERGWNVHICIIYTTISKYYYLLFLAIFTLGDTLIPKNRYYY